MRPNKTGFLKIDILKIFLPSLSAVVLFVIVLFGVALPDSKENLLAQKKEMIVTLTQTTWNILFYFENQVKSKALTETEAQQSAIKVIRNLRYGKEGKDYYWINDLQPKMIMHPYRPDLEGRDLSNYADPNGKRLFNEFVKTAKENKFGFVPYVWQWKDDPERIVEKLSYVKLFQPWGWIIGTGVYLEDVQREIALVSKKMLVISGMILVVIILLSGYIIRQGLKETNRRRIAEKELEQYHNQLEKLVKQRTHDLQEALNNVKLLSGFLPICASCKKIRDDKGYWNQIELYIRDHSEAEFSHSICPDCTQKLYGDLNLEYL